MSVSVPELIGWFEENFDCQMGEEKPYMEFEESDGYVNRVTYKLWAWPATKQGRQAVNAAQRHFKNMLDDETVRFGQRMYWRYPEKLFIESGYLKCRVGFLEARQ